MSAPFRLVKAGREDMPAMTELLYRAFPDPEIQKRFMGPNTPQQRQYHVDAFLKILDDDPGDYWVKVEDSDTGALVAVSEWRMYINRPPGDWPSLPRPWLEDDPELKKREDEIRQMKLAERRKRYTMPFISLKMMFVDPSYARRGAGGMMLKWGCTLADHLFLPMWVEASPEGLRLYERFGFVQESDFLPTGDCFMWREVPPSTIVGGKPKVE